MEKAIDGVKVRQRDGKTERRKDGKPHRQRQRNGEIAR